MSMYIQGKMSMYIQGKMSMYIQGNSQRMRLRRQIYGIYSVLVRAYKLHPPCHMPFKN